MSEKPEEEVRSFTPLAQLVREEGNEYRWINGKTGYSCYIRRNMRTLTWNGYVELPKTHSCYDSIGENLDIEVYGGITFSGHGVHGFDTAHAGDIMPNFPNIIDEGSTYKTKEFVIKEVNKMAEQFKELDGC